MWDGCQHVKKMALNIPAAQVNNVTIMNKQQNKEKL